MSGINLPFISDLNYTRELSMKNKIYILGISAFYHDSAACLLLNGEPVAAAQEERFTRKKHDPGFPGHAIEFCMKEAGIGINQIDHIVFYDKPIPTFERLLLSYMTTAPKGLRSWLKAMPVWLKKKLNIPKIIRTELGYSGSILFTEHHEAHAASAFYPSPFQESAILTIDGVGEWNTTSYGIGSGKQIDLTKEINFPNSLGLLYSAFTYFIGFRVNSGEYKLMGLAPYGQPTYKDQILKHIVDIKSDGSFRLNMDYFDFIGGLKMTSKRFEALFGGPARNPETDITQREMDIAASIQSVTEHLLLKMASHIHSETRMENLCLSGGVALNCVAVGRLIREGPFKEIWVQPAAGDAGSSLGAALSVWHSYLDNDRSAKSNSPHTPFLGPAYSQKAIENFLEKNNYPFHRLDGRQRNTIIAENIAAGKVIGYMTGRMEFGPRALGARSIIGDPRQPGMQDLINMKIKFRESFRPFAPTILEEKAAEYFELDRPSPYMLIVTHLQSRHLISTVPNEVSGIQPRLHQIRSIFPAITHIDYSSRVQTLNRQLKPDYYDIISAFEHQTGCPLVINTSFNVRGEPIVCTPEDAYHCFMKTGMDVLVLENTILFKNEQSGWKEKLTIEPLHETKTNEIRKFGVIAACFFGLLAIVSFCSPAPLAAIFFGSLFALGISFAVTPVPMAPVYRAWLKVAGMMAQMTTALLLLILFYGVICPAALFKKIWSGSPLPMYPDPSMISYWAQRPETSQPKWKFKKRY